MDSPPTIQKSSKATAIVVTTALLSFISFWRAGAIVLCDLGSSAFYAAGIAEKSIGKAAPWFILGIMLFANCVRMVYVESCSLFVRGGVYKVVKKAMGGTMAKLSVSALMFDYVLTGPISAVSAGQYLVGFINQCAHLWGWNFVLNKQYCAMAIATVIIVYFWRKNVIGIEESSDKALKILVATTVVAVVMIGFCLVTLWQNPAPLPPFEVQLNPESLGWLKDFSWIQHIGFIGTAVGLLVGLGHSLLAMSGEESLAQVYREIEAPKLKNLKRTALLIGAFSFIFTTSMSFFAVMIIPDQGRATYAENLIGGLAMHVVGGPIAHLILNAAVTLIGFLILSGAVNTSLVGSNGVLNRVAEDGVLSSWFRMPHHQYGTTSNTLNMVVVFQLLAVFICRGDIYLLGEAYAFGVIWSFTFKALAMVMLRFKDKTPREWKVPLNFHFGRTEIPLGLILIFLTLFALALVNFFTKPIATEWGLIFTAFFFVLFKISEHNNKKKSEYLHPDEDEFQEKVNLNLKSELNAATCDLTKEKRILVTVRDPNNLYHLKKILEEFNPDTTDCVVMTAKLARPYQIETEFNSLQEDEESLLTQVVNLAEKAGKTVTPILVPTSKPFYAIARAAYDLGVQEVVMGLSGKTTVEAQMEGLAIAWGEVNLSHNIRNISFKAIWPGREFVYQI